MTNLVPVTIVDWCGQQVYHQQDNALRVVCMVKAWQYAKTRRFTMRELDIININSLVLSGKIDPEHGYRNVPVLVQYRPVTHHQHVAPLMQNLMETWFKSLSPEEFARELLIIHPFRDGNGRTAAILYNWMKHTLDDPFDLPPMKFD